jgi:phosphoserine phosphatase
MQKVGNLLSQGSLKIQQVYNYFTVDNGSALINSVTNNNSTQKSVSVTTKTLTKAEQIKENAAKGKQGELLAGVDPTKPKERIDSYSPKVEYRIPDILNHDETFLVEVKNVTKLSLTEQLRDFILWTQERGYKFILITRDDTTISKPLQEMINAGKIIWQTFKTK